MSSTHRPTMQQVAHAANVSLKTVSRVVNGEPHVSAETAEQVREVIDRLGFHRNDGARLLRSGRADSIGLVLDDPTGPFLSQVALGVERVVRMRRDLLLSGSGDGDPEQERRLVASFVSRRVNGLVVVPTGEDYDWLQREVLAGTPVVLVDRPVGSLSADAVVSDNEGGARSAVEHLVAQGHRQIGFLGDSPELWTARRRREGFCRSAQELGLPAAPVAMGRHDAPGLMAVVERWTSQPDPVTAVVTGSNRVSLVLLRGFAARGGLAAPAVVGFDDLELADLLDPPLTVVAQQGEAMGRRAGELLYERIDGHRGPPRRVTTATRLLVRASGQLRPAARPAAVC